MGIDIAEKECRVKDKATLDKLKVYLIKMPIPSYASEPEVRKRLMPFVEVNDGWVMYDGNTIWNVKKLVKHFTKFINNYKEENLTKYLYEFFHLQCGSIAHYNKTGWFETYPTRKDLEEFFMKNEYGQRVEDYPPEWHHDARQATGAMHRLLLGVKYRQDYPRY